MSHYKANLRDLEFNLFEFGARTGSAQGPFAELDVDTVKEVLREVRTLAEGPSRRRSWTPTGTRRSTTRPRR